MGFKSKSIQRADESTALRYLVAAIMTLGALGLRMLLDPVLRDQATYLTFLLAVLAASRFGGFSPGMLATALSALALDWFFIEPRESLHISSPKAMAGLALFCAAGFVISLMVGRLRSSLVCATSGHSALQAGRVDTASGPRHESAVDSVRGILSAKQLKRRPHLIWFGLAIFLVIIEGILFLGTWTRFSGRERGSLQTRQVLEHIASLFSALQDAETGQRGYLLTGKDTYLKPYDHAIGVVSSLLDELRGLTADNPEQQKRTGDLRALAAAKLEKLRKTIEVQKTNGAAAALEIVQTDNGKQLMDQVRDSIAAMKATELTLLDKRNASLMNAATGMSVVMFSGIGLLLILLVSGSRAIDRHTAERAKSEERLRASEERFAKAFAVNPAAVAMTDLQDGRFLDVNAAWEAMNGYTREELTGRSARDFRMWPASEDRERFVRELKQTGAIQGREQTFLTKSGQSYTALFSAVIVNVGDKEVVLSALLDATEQKRAAEALSQLNQQLEQRVAERTAQLVEAGEKVRAERQRFLDMLDTLPVIISIIRQDYQVEWTNHAYRQALGDNAGELCYQGQFGFNVPCEECQTFTPLQSGQPHNWEWTLPDGRTFDIHNFPFAAADGTPAVLTMHLDITERRRAEAVLEQRVAERTAQLQASEDQFRTLANTIPQLCWTAKADGWIDWYNERWYRYTGTTPEQMEGWGWQSVHDPEALPKVLERWQASIATGQPFDMVFPLRGGDGVFRPFLTRVMPVFDRDGQVARWFGTNTDIAEQQRAEEALRTQADLLRLSFDAIIVWRFDGAIESWNIGAEKLYGFSGSEAIGRVTHDLLATVFPKPWPEIRADLVEKGSWEGELRHHTRGGDEVVVSARKQLLRDAAGIERVLEINRDITQQKRAQEALLASNSRFRSLFENAAAGILIADWDGRLLECNDAFCRLLGYSHEELAERHFTTLIPREDLELHLADTRRLKSGEIPYFENESGYVRKDGQTVCVHQFLSPLPDSTGRGRNVVALVTDISERKRAEAAFRESEQRVRTLGDNLPNGAIYRYRADPVGMPHVDFISAGIERITGVPAAEFMADGDVVSRSILPEDRNRLRAAIESSRDRLSQFELEVRHKHRTTGEIRWSLLRSTPARLPDGSTVWDGIEIDVTERKLAEEILRRNEARQSFLIKLSDGLRPLADPREIQFEASRILGEHLGAGRVGYAECEGDEQTVMIPEHYTDGMPYIEGRHNLNDYGGTLVADLKSGIAIVRGDIANDPELTDREKAAFAALPLGSMADIPLVKSGRLIAILFIHYRQFHNFDAGEMSLAEEVAERTWAAVERARAEAALRESEERFRLAQELSPDGFTIFRPLRDEDGKVADFLWVYENDAVARMNGTDPRAVPGRRLLEVFPGHRGTQILKAYQQVAESGERQVLEAEYHGDTISDPTWFRLAVVPAGGDIAILAQDITERKRADERLRISEEKFSKAFATNPAALSITRLEDGLAMDVNDTWQAMMGYRREEAIGRSTTDLKIWPTMEARVQYAKDLREKSALTGREETLLRRSGEPFVALLSAAILDIAEEEVVLSACLDISDRKRAELALRESEASYRSLFDNMLNFMCQVRVIFDGEQVVDWEYLAVNRAFLQAGRGSANVVGKRLSEIIPHIAQTDPGLFDILGRVARTGAAESCELWLESWKEWCDLAVYRQAPDQVVILYNVITGRKLAEEQVQQAKSELEVRVRERTAQLEAANKELEAFAYSVSHDLRAPLRGIDGWSLALVEDYARQLDERALEYLGRVRSEAQRMGDLIDDMLQLSRIGRSQMEHQRVDLSAIARAVAGRLREAHPERKVEFVIPAGLTAKGDAGLLEIALTNLLGNAVKFTAPRDEARVEFGAIQRDGACAFYVRDNGVGFNLNSAGKLFGAFQRFHKASQFPGTGIGLATVQRIVHRHGGRVWAEAEPGKGATFYFTLDAQ